MNPDLQQALDELAATAQYLRESGRLMREAVEHLIESERRIEQTNAFMRIVIERVERRVLGGLV